MEQGWKAWRRQSLQLHGPAHQNVSQNKATINDFVVHREAVARKKVDICLSITSMINNEEAMHL